MARKKWEAKTDITPTVLKFREKRKWQIALRRYVLEKKPALDYAPYFGLDIKSIRLWFEGQFNEELNWKNFGKAWQFDHIVPVTYFDFSIDEELKMCWNFTNLRVDKIQKNSEKGGKTDILASKAYFNELYKTTKHPICQKMLYKIDEIEAFGLLNTKAQQVFIQNHTSFLESIKNYGIVEFDLLNKGRTVEEVNKEIDFLKSVEAKLL